MTLDDLDTLGQAERQPQDLVRRAPAMTIAEVQRSPDLLPAVTRAMRASRCRRCTGG